MNFDPSSILVTGGSGMLATAFRKSIPDAHYVNRAELDIAYRTLFDRIPTLRLARAVEDLPFKYDGAVFGLYELPVAW